MWILHVDMDAFFASVEQKLHPHLMTKPMAVGSDPRKGNQRGVISSASYEARKFGVKSAMSSQKALLLCPQLEFSFSGFEHYNKESKEVMKILKGFSEKVQIVGIDEAFLGFADLPLNEILLIAKNIKSKIFQITNLNSSIGIGSNKSIAKICSKLAKPFGIHGCRKGNEKKFLAPLSIDYLWGTGPVTAKSLNDLGIYTIKQLNNFPIEILEHYIKSQAKHLKALAQGYGSRNLEERESYKSISKEKTFMTDISNKEILLDYIFVLCDQVSRKALYDKIQPKTLTLKIRNSSFETFSRSSTLDKVPKKNYLFYHAQRIMQQNSHLLQGSVRLIGVKLSNFLIEKKQEQIGLFPE